MSETPNLRTPVTDKLLGPGARQSGPAPCCLSTPTRTASWCGGPRALGSTSHKAAQFHDKYLTRRITGGEALADELQGQLRTYLGGLFGDGADTLDLTVRVYANLEGMANVLARDGRVRNLGQLRAFATGFCGRVVGFDWVDVGVGREGVGGRKVRGESSAACFGSPLMDEGLTKGPESLSLFASAPNVRHILVASPLSTLSPSLLQALPATASIPSTKVASGATPPALVTLVLPTNEPNKKSAAPTSTPSSLATTTFPSLFRTPPPLPPPPSATSKSRPQLQLAQSENREGGSTWLVIRPERSKSQGAGRRRAAGSGTGAGEEEVESGVSISIDMDGGRERGRRGA